MTSFALEAVLGVLQGAAVFALAARRGAQAAAALAVSEVLIPQRRRIEAEGLHATELRLGALATAALTDQPSSSPSQ